MQVTGLVDTRELRRFVVRVSGPGGGTLGTGFFVAPGWVVTCAHVVEQLGEVMVTPADPRVVAPPVWRVVARSAPPPAGWRSAFWPFPDLAVLRTEEEADHPCPLLEPRDPGPECYAWGYPQVEAGVEPDGSPASFRFEGVTGRGFLQLKAGQAAPGISGSPLVCPVRRAVVGVVAVSRDTTSDLGGWAMPVSALLAGGEGVPEDLAEVGSLIRSANRDAAIRYRREWNAVLPVDTDGVLSQPWAEFTRGPRSVPSSMLRADFGVVPYMFRDAEVAATVEWCERAGWAMPVSVMQVTARGGAGKTRFAIELCKQIAAAGWAAGLWREGAAGLDRLPVPRLVVIDYAEEALAASLRDALDALARHATGMAPVQVLMLTRARTGQSAQALGEIGKDAPATLVRVLDQVQDYPVPTQPLSLGQRTALYTEAVDRFTGAWCQGLKPGPVTPVTAADPDMRDDRYGLPLEVLFEALVTSLRLCGEGPLAPPPDGGPGGLAGQPPAQRVLEHEERYWQLTAPGAYRDDVSLLRECAGLATLAGASDQPQAHALLSVPSRLGSQAASHGRRDLISWLHSLYDGPQVLNPLRPDRLGEALVGRMLRDQEDGGTTMLASVLGLESDDQAEQCLDVLARMCAYDPTTARTAAKTISGMHADLVERADAQSHATADRLGRTALASASQRLLTSAFCDLVSQELADAEPGNTMYRRDLSVSFNKLADLAVAAGEGDRARGLFEQSLAIRQELADAEPGNTMYRRDLSVSLERLADLAVAAGEGDRARGLFEQSLAIAQELADAEPGNTMYRRDLSVSLERLADLAVAAGEGDRARGLFEQSLAIAQELADAEPGNTMYRRDLSVSFNKLADLAVAAGEGDRARGLFEQSLAIAQELADAEPGNTMYRRDLSVSFNKLADLAVAAGEGDRARGLFEQSLAIRQELADAEPGNTMYRRDLSVSFNKLADLAVAAGEGDRARGLFEQSLAIAQELADAEPGNTMYRRDLSVSFNKLADLAVAAGEGDRARGLFEQSLAIRQELADAEPGNTMYRRDLSVSFNKLADLAVAAGEGDRARGLFEQSLAIAQELADAEPGNTMYRRDLSVSFNKLADLAVAAGEGDRARGLFEQSLAIAQELADAEPGNTMYRRDLSVSFNKLADLAVAAGEGDRARGLFEQSLAIRQELADAEPGNTMYRRDLSVSLERLADLAVAAGEGDRARGLFEQSLAIAQELADAEPGNTMYRRDLSVSFNKLADLAVAAGEGDRARGLFEQSLAIAQELADAEPGNTMYRRDLSVSFERLADLAVAAGEGERAMQWVSHALKLRRALVRNEPERLDLSVELAYVLYLSTRTGENESAHGTAAREAIQLLEQFERLGHMTPRAGSLLAWARQQT